MISVRKIIVTNYISQAWVAFIGLAFLPLFIKYLGVEAYGLVGFFALIQTWLALLDMGMTPTLNREMARFHAGAHEISSIKNLLRSLEVLCIGISVFIVLVVFCSSDWLASSWLKVERMGVKQVSEGISIIAFIVGLRFMEGLYRGGLLGLHKQIWYNVANALLATIRNVGAVIVMLFSPSIISFFVWQAIISFITVLIYAYKLNTSLPRTGFPSRFSIDAISKIWKFAGGMFSITILSLLLTQIDKLLLSKLISLESFSYYTLAATLAGVLFMIVGPITQAVYPKIINLITLDKKQELIHLYHRSAQLVTVMTGTLTAVVCIYSSEVIYVWSGQYSLAENTGSILAILIVGNFLNVLMYLPYHMQLANGWTTLAFKTNLVAVCLLGPAILIVVPKYGVVSAALIWCLLNAFYVFIVIQIMHKKLLKTEMIKWYVQDVFNPLIGPITICLLARLFIPNFDGRLAWFGFFIVVGIISFLSSILFSNNLKVIVSDYFTRLLRNKLSDKY